jgi:hypothetical protein
LEEVEVTKLVIELRDTEKRALETVAREERRDLHNQAAHLVRLELERRGLLHITADGWPRQVEGVDRVAA